MIGEVTSLIRGRIRGEEVNPVNRALVWAYDPVARFALRFRYAMIAIGVLGVALTYPIYKTLGSEFMPPLWGNTLLYMPSALPGASIETVRRAIQEQDKILAQFGRCRSKRAPTCCRRAFEPLSA